MAVHERVLETAIRLCRERGGWTFSPNEIVKALPSENPRTVRTHVISRCCVNAPRNHPHKWDYFRRVSRSTYEVLPKYRPQPAAKHVREARTPYLSSPTLRDTVHAVITRSGHWYVAECLELSVVTQGQTLDETVANLRDAIGLHLEGEQPADLGLTPSPRLTVSYDLAVPRVSSS